MANQPEKIVLAKGDPVSNRECATRFVELVRGMPAVRSVLWDSVGYTPLIWTILDALPDDLPTRYAVFDAEVAAMDEVPDAFVGFRLINLAEFQGSRPEELIPCDAETLWQRDA